MDTSPDSSSVKTPHRWFYGLAVLLMLGGVAAAFVQRVRESSIATSVAKRISAGIPETDSSQNEVQQMIRNAERWQGMSFVAVLLAFASWVIAVQRQEKRRGSWAILLSLLALYIGLELLMV